MIVLIIFRQLPQVMANPIKSSYPKAAERRAKEKNLLIVSLTMPFHLGNICRQPLEMSRLHPGLLIRLQVNEVAILNFGVAKDQN